MSRGEVHCHRRTNQFLSGGCVPDSPTNLTGCIKHTHTHSKDSLNHTPPHVSFFLHSLSLFFLKKKMPLQSTLSGGGTRPDKAVDTQSSGKSYEELRHECLQKGVLFEDEDFPAADSSLYYSQSVPVNIEWKRPKVCRHT